MIERYIKGRVGIFIDESNLFHSQKSSSFLIDYNKLFWLLRDLDQFNKSIFLYTSFIKVNENQIKFINKLVDYGYIVHSKEVKEIKDLNGNIFKKGNLDIELALDAFRFASIYDTLILFSGDSDFAYLLDLLRERGKNIIVVSSKKNVSRELLRRGKFIDIKDLRYSIEYIKSTKPPK